MDHVRLRAVYAFGLEKRFCWQEKKESSASQLLACFGQCERLEIELCSNIIFLSIQKLKYLFLFLLWSETKLSIENGPSTLVGFIDWGAT